MAVLTSSDGVVEAALSSPARLEVLDRPKGLLTSASEWVGRRPGLDAFLRGTWLGHPLHAAVVTVPLGMGAAAVVADLLPRARPAVRPLLAVGALAAVPAAASGLADVRSLRPPGERVAVVHVLANTIGLTLQAAAMVSPWPLQRRLLRLGVAASAVAGAYGGQLAYRHRLGTRP